MMCLKVTAALVLIVASGCTATPEKYKRNGVMPVSSPASVADADNAKAQAVAAASIGVPQVYVDQKVGTSVELVVQSEYFSANGRTCRRYAEIVNGQSIPGVSCQDDARGWIDIPLSSFVQ